MADVIVKDIGSTLATKLVKSLPQTQQKDFRSIENSLAEQTRPSRCGV